jgi:hypothetical protein
MTNNHARSDATPEINGEQDHQNSSQDTAADDHGESPFLLDRVGKPLEPRGGLPVSA